MSVDKAFQDVFKAMKNVKWRDCENSQYKWYYAEDCHYIIKDEKTNALWFVKAKSPQNAFDIVKNKLTTI